MVAWNPTVGAYRAGAAVARSLPLPVLSAASRALARKVVDLSPERRLIVERNLRRVYGDDLGPEALARSVDETFESYARYWLESFRLPSLSASEVDAGFSYTGFEHIAEARARGTGVIVALPHLGGWEWAAFWLALIPKVPVTAVVEALEPPELFEWFVDYRRSLGMNVVPVGPHAGTEVVHAIRDGHVVCLLCDRDLSGTGIEVEFFGETTTLPAGPATLAIRTGAPLVPAAVLFTEHGRRCVLEPPLPVERRGKLRADIARITQDLARALEGLIRRAPEQWHLMEPNWPSDIAAREALVAGPAPTTTIP
jgi:KDO2-lipid IV(A) lauroyltransferase